MSSNFAKWGQQKKRQAVRHTQQSAKRQASQQRNPFTWTRDHNEEEDLTQPGSSSKTVFSIPTASNLVNNPFVTATEIKPPLTLEAGSSNVFLKEPTPIQHSDPEVFAAPPSYSAPSRGKRNPKTKAQNRLNLINEFKGFKLSGTVNLNRFQRKRGTCMHMCSVQEFSKRLEQDIYSMYETENGTFSHHLAVKEYQRASADQEESQPEDLRPSVILLKTVQYLFINLFQRHGENLDDMYNFIWNRTRAIRKDITQQKLCDIKTVTVLETIGRFHIFSAYHLSGSSTENFEHKYNNENLEKTLTSLRHLYNDISSEQGACKNEAEFRMYHILLNLNNSLVLRDVSNLPLSILNSSYVRYALCCYNAYNSRNFVRFFKLFTGGPLLACCILYRFVYDIRQKALGAIINSHTAPSRAPGGGPGIEYPTEKLMSLLGCESIENTAEFVQGMGVELTEDLCFAVLKNRQYNVNENCKLTYRFKSIDSKIIQPMGRHIFTEELLSDDVLGGPIPQSPTLPPASVVKTSPVPSQILDDVVNQYVANFAFCAVPEMIKECIRELQFLERSKIHIIKELIDEACQAGLRQEFTNIKNGVKKQVMFYTKEVYKDWYPSPLLDIILLDLVKETCVEEAGVEFIHDTQMKVLTQSVQCELRSILRAESAYLNKYETNVTHACELTLTSLINSVTDGQLSAVLSEVKQELLSEKKATLQSQLDNCLVQKRYFFKIWKRRYSKIYAKRHTLDNIPPRVGSYSSAEVLKSLLGGQQGSTQNRSHLSLSSIAQMDLTSPTKSFQKKIEVRKKLKLRMDLLEEAMSLNGIPLQSISSLKKPVYVTIALENLIAPLSKFVLDSFGLSVPNNLEGINGHYMKLVHVGETKLKMQLVDLSTASRKTFVDSCKGSQCIVIQTNRIEDITTASNLQLTASMILICLEQPSFWINRYVPEPCKLTNIRYCNLYKALDSAVSEAIVIEKCSPPFKLIDVKDYTQSLICVKLTDILLAKQVVLKGCKLYSIDPNTILCFYNSLIRHLSKAVIDPRLCKIDWPNQFDQRKNIDVNWNDISILRELSQEVQRLCLPGFIGDPESPEDCLRYCSSIQTLCPQFLLSTVSSILDNSGVQWCLILNQVIHHCIENAMFSRGCTVLLDSQISEINALNGERMVESALVLNELESELSEYNVPLPFNESDISEIWESLAFYETKLSTRSEGPEKKIPVDYLMKESSKINTMTEDLEKLSSSISETESRLQSIINEGALPSYLVKSLLGNK